MKEDRVNVVIEEIELGFIPYELDYNIQTNCFIEWNKFCYNEWDYREFWINKMPQGLLEQFPCLDYMIDELYNANKGITPLMELENRK
jgi:hypothetical protein